MTTPQEMAAAMARLWEKFLPEMEQRIALIEVAAQALGAGSLTEEQREAAHAAAHKLAGSLGLFGMTQGTEVARGLETSLESAPLDAAVLSNGVRELRAMIAARNQAALLH